MKTLTTSLLFIMFVIVGTAQEMTLKGKVSDQNGMPLPGANIVVKNSTIGTQTDFDGDYEIKAQLGDILVYTYVGLKTVEKTVGTSNIINVVMEEDASLLDEVVVSAMGVKRERKALGYAVNAIKPTKRKRRDIARMLSGKASGVQITSQSGTSGSGTNVVIRGNTSIKGNSQALFVIDGVHYNSRQVSKMNLTSKIKSKNIKSIDVLNGLSATSLYGSAGKNGVIVINTKNGNFIPNQLELANESYEEIVENKFERTTLSPLSTFSIDVDRASYSNIRRMINQGQKIPNHAVKIEEMINYFDYSYPQPKGEHPFTINTELATTPWNNDTQIVKIGLQGRTYDYNDLPSSNLTFLIDVSGSMGSDNKLPLLKRAFKLLVKNLRKQDKVSIVVYAGAAGVVLKPTPGDQKEKILEALNNLNSGGSTAGGEGIELAYKLAQRNFLKNGNNRVILATDGDFNVGASSNKAMERLIEKKRESGVFLSVLGFGYGNYKDSKLEILADKGNGNHAYIDNMQEAQKVFGKEFGGTLHTIAKDVKIQVEFNPSKVQAYRLIGYENRLLNDEDFIDDTKDAGELGSGHTVTALYEVIPVGVKSKYLKKINELKYIKPSIDYSNYSEELLTVKFRYKKPNSDKSIEMIHIMKDELTEASSDLKFASAVALFGMHLRQSEFLNKSSLKDVISLATNSKGKDTEGYKAEFVRLVKAYN